MRLSSDCVFFPKPYPNTYKQKKKKEKKENPHSIVIIIEFLSIFFVAFCIFLTLIHCYYLVRLDLFFTAQEGEEENNLLVILYNKSVIIRFFFSFSVSMLISIWQIWRKYTKDVMFEYHIWQPSDRTYM